MASNSDKMAVTVDNHTNTPVNEHTETDVKVVVATSKVVSDGVHKKKTFKITSVTKNRGGSSEAPIGELDGDSLEDLDETVESHTEDASSEILDGSKYEDVGEQSPLEDNNFSTDAELEAGKEAKEHTVTRFKVVKVETKEPFHRGRWTCRDSLDTPAVSEGSDTKISFKDKEKTNSGNSSACSSIHYDYGQDDPSKNPLLTGYTLNQVNDQLNEVLKNQPTGLVMNQNPVNVHMTQTGQLVWSDGTQMPQSSMNLAASYGMHPNPSNPNMNAMPKLMYGVPAMSDQATLQSYINAMNISVTGASNYAPTNQSVVSVSQGHGVMGSQSQAQQQSVSVQAIQNGHHGHMHISNAPVITSLSNSINVSAGSEIDYTQQPTNIHPQTSLNPSNDVYSVPQIAPTSQIHSPGEYREVKVSESPNVVPSNLPINMLASQSQTEQVAKASENISEGVPADPQSQREGEELGNPSMTPILTESAVAEAVGSIASPTKEDAER